MCVGFSSSLNRSLDSAGADSNYQKPLFIIFSNGRGFICNCVLVRVFLIPVVYRYTS